MENVVSSFIAFLSFLGAALAALYARWAWREARRANEISVHSNRMDIYRAFHKLRFEVQSRSIGIESHHVAPFFHPSREARFYFSNADTAQRLVEYFEVCFGLVECARRQGRAGLSDLDLQKLYGEQDALLEREQMLFRQVEKGIEEELFRAVKSPSRLV